MTPQRREYLRAYRQRTAEKQAAQKKARVAAKPPLTAERLRELVHYDPVTGIFTSRINCGKVRVGDASGKINRDGYRQIQVDGRLYSAHRLAWLYVHGRWPTPMVDHESRDKDDNRIANLREVTKSQNQQNIGPQSNNKSGYKGVREEKRTGRWRAQIRIDGVQHHLGTFATPELASAAYAAAAARLHTHNPAAERRAA